MKNKFPSTPVDSTELSSAVTYFTNLMSEIMSDLSPKKQLNLSLGCQLIVSLGFAISTLFVASFANVGFNIVATALANAVFALGALYVINQKQDPGSVGLIIGAGTVMSFLSLLTAIYWGELSRCQEVNENISKYTCKDKAAMVAVCVFATLIFGLQVHFTAIVYFYKTHILAESQQYAEVPTSSLESDDYVESMYPRRDEPRTWSDPKPVVNDQNFIIV